MFPALTVDALGPVVQALCLCGVSAMMTVTWNCKLNKTFLPQLLWWDCFYYSNRNETRTTVKGHRHPNGIFSLLTTLYDPSSSELKCSCCPTGHLNVHSVPQK